MLLSCLVCKIAKFRKLTSLVAGYKLESKLEFGEGKTGEFLHKLPDYSKPHQEFLLKPADYRGCHSSEFLPGCPDPGTEPGAAQYSSDKFTPYSKQF